MFAIHSTGLSRLLGDKGLVCAVHEVHRQTDKNQFKPGSCQQAVFKDLAATSWPCFCCLHLQMKVAQAWTWWGGALRLPMSLWEYTANQTGNVAKSSRCCFNDNLNRVTSSSDGNERDHEALENKILNVQICWWNQKVAGVEINNIDCFTAAVAAHEDARLNTNRVKGG